MQAGQSEKAQIVRVKSKEEIVQNLEQERQLRQHKQEQRGLRMQGSSGSLDLTEVDKM